MEFLHLFIPVFMKYDFTSQKYGPNVAKDWIECRVNVKPNVTKRCIRITVYPKCYNETIPNFVLDINRTSTNIDYGPVKSRSKVNVFGMLWNDEQNEKCRIFIAFDNKGIRHNFGKYFKELLKLHSIAATAAITENDCKNKSTMCNEAVKMTSNSNHHHHHQQANASSIQIMRVSNASDSCEDVVLRPKPVTAPNQNHRLARSLAAISGLFKSIRDSGGINHKKNDENSTKVSPMTTKTKRKTWNIFKLKEVKPPCDDAMPTFQRFQEPLNIERPSLAGGNIDVNGYSDAEWYDLNKDEMNLLEARVSNLVSDFNSYNRINSNSKRITESSNILRSRNNLSSSSSCKSNAVNFLPETQTNANGKQKCSTLTQSIRLRKSVEPMILIDDIMTKSMDFDCNCNFNESCKLSSGFGSGESDTNSPQEFVRKFKAFTDSPTTSDFFENAFSSANQSNDDLNECLPNTAAVTTSSSTTYGDAHLPIVKNMQKMSKKHRIQINSRKLFGIPNEVHTPSSLVNVTPRNKSSSMECRSEKVRNGTPFKIRSMKQKQMYVTDV